MAISIATGAMLMAVFGASSANGDAPRVVSTNPHSNALLAAGPLKLSVAFHRPMRADSFSFVQKDPVTFPNCGRNIPVQSADGRTFTLACTVEPGRSYEVWFNSPPYMNFKAVDGTPAVPFQLRFRTEGR